MRTTRIAVRRGFTLTEVLIAIIVLLVGVVAALQIFPPGFAAFTESQQTYVAQALNKNWLATLDEHPDNLPDAILPVNMAYDDAVAGQFRFDDLAAVDFRNTATVWDWYTAGQFPTGNDRWPLWEPLSARMLRRIVGEKIAIPTVISSDPGNAAIKYALVPKAIPMFTPIMPQGTWVGNSFVPDTTDPIILYDMRYRQVSKGRLHDFGNPYCYAEQTTASSNPGLTALLLPASNSTTNLRLTFMYTTTGKDYVHVPPANIQLPQTTTVPVTKVFTTAAGTTVTVTATLDDTGIITLTLSSGYFVPGSEQLNRAYRFDTSVTTAADIANLASGTYYMQTGTDNLLLGAIFFSKEDAGRKVKIDYIVADWNILHEDITVDDNGYVTLSLANPKIAYRQPTAREPKTWGLYRPMHDVGTDVVMGIIDKLSGMPYHVMYPHNYSRATRPSQPYAVIPQSGNPDLSTNPAAIIDLSEAARGRVRIGGLQPGLTWRGVWDAAPPVDYHLNDVVHDTVSSNWYQCIDAHQSTPATEPGAGPNWENKWAVLRMSEPAWDALKGQTFRIYYRAQRDWTLQVFKPPTLFWYTSAANQLGWDRFTIEHDLAQSTCGTRVTVPALYGGQSVAVDYAYWPEFARVEDDSTTQTVRVENASALQEDEWYKIVNPSIDASTVPKVLGIFQVTIDTITREVTLSPTPSEAVLRGAVFIQDDEVYKLHKPSQAPSLKRVNGEIHAVPIAGTGATSDFRLQHFPCIGAPVYLRGVSVTVRGLWTQPRSSYAHLIDTGKDFGSWRPINERWQAKSVTAILSPSKE